jgi:hypothetical protein
MIYSLAWVPCMQLLIRITNAISIQHVFPSCLTESHLPLPHFASLNPKTIGMHRVTIESTFVYS